MHKEVINVDINIPVAVIGGDENPNGPKKNINLDTLNIIIIVIDSNIVSC